MSDQLQPESQPIITAKKARSPKPTREEHERREALCYDLMHKGLRPSQIKRLCSGEWGVSSRTVEGYMRRAREKLVAEIGEDKSELRADAFAFYRGVVSNPDAPLAHRLRAQERIDQLLGLNAPTKVSVTDPTGTGPGTINVASVREMSDEDLAKLAGAFDVLENRNGAKSG